MTRVSSQITVFCFFLFLAGHADAFDRAGFDELTRIMDSAKVMEVDVFAPKVWEKAVQSYQQANKSIDSEKKQKTIDKDVAKAREYVENALKASEVCRLSLQEYLEPREKARQAGGPVLVPELYQKAEDQFIKATAKVESGDVRNGLKEAEKSVRLFDVAELEAIRADILGPADRLIEKALADDAGKFALSTLDKARTAREKANAILTNNRYNRTEAIQEASRAEYQARHASNIGLSVRSLKRNDQAWEKLMLIYEIQMNRVGKVIGFDNLPFDDGPLAAADTLIHAINDLKAENERLSTEGEDLSSGVIDQLRQTLALLEVSPGENDPVTLAEVLNERVSDLLVEKNSLDKQVQTSQAQLSELSREHEEVSAELSERLEQEEKFKQAKMKLNPSEGEVLFNSSNDIVLRLGGLSFDIGKSEIKDEHVPLLEKVKEIIQMFPEARLVVEGHTDASGDASANVLLSEKRAFAVMQYLRQSLLISADRIQSIGYGADRPIASNQTTKGRAKNRRIDVIIMQ